MCIITTPLILGTVVVYKLTGRKAKDAPRDVKRWLGMGIRWVAKQAVKLVPQPQTQLQLVPARLRRRS